MAIKKFLIAGYGYVGSRLGKAIRHYYSDAIIISLNRQKLGSDDLSSVVDTHISHDLDGPGILSEGDLLDSLEAIYYLIPPPRAGVSDTRIEKFLRDISRHRPGKIIAISTTGVYGDCKGAWVDETFPVRPQTDRARRRANAEEQLMSWSRQFGIITIILRVPGIYGPGKLPIDRLNKALPVLDEHESPWSNRVHVDDLVQACINAYHFGDHTDVYNVSDGRPSTMTDFFMRVADVFEIPRPPVVSLDEAKDTLSDGMLSYLQESKKIDNQKMIRELKVALQYPDLQTGLASCHSSEDS